MKNWYATHDRCWTVRHRDLNDPLTFATNTITKRGNHGESAHGATLRVSRFHLCSPPGHALFDSTMLQVHDVAEATGVSVRTSQRLFSTYMGVPLSAVIRRRRLQEAAERVRAEPHTSLADIAHELGYADHAHLTRDFATVLGFTPSNHRTAP